MCRWLMLIIVLCILKGIHSTYSTDKRIIGGKLTGIKYFSFQVSIIVKNSRSGIDFRGSAVIISETAALTSGINFKYNLHKGLITNGLVYLRGNVSKWNYKATSVDHQIVDVIVHPKYKAYLGDYDIAIVRVNSVFYAMYETPIRVAGGDYQYQFHEYVIIVGWGKSEFKREKDYEDYLRYVPLKIIGHPECYRLYKELGESQLPTPRMLCAISAGKGPCSWDYGGPAISRGVLVGLISWNMHCGEDKPVLMTYVPYFYSWLNAYVDSIAFNPL